MEEEKTIIIPPVEEKPSEIIDLTPLFANFEKNILIKRFRILTSLILDKFGYLNGFMLGSIVTLFLVHRCIILPM